MSFPFTPPHVVTASEFNAAYGVTGRVDTDGTILAGTGFTVSHGGTGTYTITFTTAFSNPPFFTAEGKSSGAEVDGITITALTASAVTFFIRDGSNDRAFVFFAREIV